jgi:hypothetical protein
MADRFFSRSSDVRWSDVVKTCLRLLAFRSTQAELIQLKWKHLIFGIGCTWIVGIGRYWDNPRVAWPQHLGLGSVVYIFLLSTFLWLIVYPLRPEHWPYLGVLTFVSLVSPPAILYAIPVEKFMSLPAANTANAWFLAIVAAWRVALLFFFLRRLGSLPWFSIVAAALLPLTLIVVGLTLLNLEEVVFDLMGGFVDPSGNDTAYGVLVALTWVSVSLFIPVLICYLAAAVSRSAVLRLNTIKSKDNDERE